MIRKFFPVVACLLVALTMSSCAKKACGGWYGDRNLSQVEQKETSIDANMAIVDPDVYTDTCSN